MSIPASAPRNRRLAVDLVPVTVLIVVGLIEPMYGLFVFPIGVALLAWALYRFWRAGR